MKKVDVNVDVESRLFSLEEARKLAIEKHGLLFDKQGSLVWVDGNGSLIHLDRTSGPWVTQGDWTGTYTLSRNTVRVTLNNDD